MIEERKRWKHFRDKWSYFESSWKPKKWNIRYRFVFIRQKVKEMVLSDFLKGSLMKARQR